MRIQWCIDALQRVKKILPTSYNNDNMSFDDHASCTAGTGPILVDKMFWCWKKARLALEAMTRQWIWQG
jgi:hypothetical protein